MKKSKASGATRVVKKQPRKIRWPEIHYHWLVIPLLLVGTVLIGRWVYQTWPVNSVEVTGRFSLWRPELIAQQLTWLKQESFFSADLSKVYRQVNDLPLLNVVTVKKQWPDAVVINVHEDIPLAIWNGEEVLTVGGDIFPRPAFITGKKLARMRGNTQYSERAMRNYRRLHQMLKNTGVSVLELEVSDVGSVSVKLSNNWLIEFGRKYFEERMKRLELLLKTMPQEKVTAVDLRYVKGAAITWHPIEEIKS